MDKPSDGGWGPWLRFMLQKYFWLILVAILLSVDYLSKNWVLSMVEKVIEKIGSISL